jgi:serine/threonine protein phosphatase PrpC
VFAVALTTEAFGLTDVGRKRQHNEDAMLVDSPLGLYVVADGMGGHAAGEVASARATEVVKQHITANRHLLKDLGNNPTADSRSAAAALVEVAVQRACADIYRMAMQDASKRGMGTTFVCLAVGGNKGVIGHVGDSRVYLVRHGQCHRLTEDHTLVAAQLKAGTITKEQAAASQYRNVITRAVGIQESVQVDTLIVDLVPGDVFILCSDGLHGYVEDEEILPLVSGMAPADLPKRLIDIANERGGKDNITAVVVKISGEGTLEAETTEAQSRMEALRKIPLFRHLTYKEQTAVLSIATTRTYPAGREIVVEGQPGEELFVVIRGRVAIEKNGVEIAELRAGGHFGEMGLIDNAPRSATVRATEPTRTMVISRPDLMGLMKRESILAVKMLWSFVQVLSDRLRATNSELSEARQELAVAQAIQPFAEE